MVSWLVSTTAVGVPDGQEFVITARESAWNQAQPARKALWEEVGKDIGCYAGNSREVIIRVGMMLAVEAEYGWPDCWLLDGHRFWLVIPPTSS